MDATRGFDWPSCEHQAEHAIVDRHPLSSRTAVDSPSHQHPVVKDLMLSTTSTKNAWVAKALALPEDGVTLWLASCPDGAHAAQ
jgi:hypothetical protein